MHSSISEFLLANQVLLTILLAASKNTADMLLRPDCEIALTQKPFLVTDHTRPAVLTEHTITFADLLQRIAIFRQPTGP